MIKRLSIYIAILMVISAIGTLAQQGGKVQREQSSGGPGIVAVSEISVQFHTISVGGRLQPMSRIVHRTPNAGFVDSLSVKEGDFVEQGQELFSVTRKDDVAKIYKPAVVKTRISGWVSEVNINQEDEIEDAEPAVVVIGTEGYVLEANISDKDAFKVKIGQNITATATGGAVIRGTLVNRSQEPDYKTGLFTLTFHFPNSQRTFIGEFVVIELPVDRAAGVFIRRDLVTRRYGRYFLWIVDGDQKLEAREVVLGPTYGDLVRIDEGLEVGERYLARLTGREKEGMNVGAPGT